MSIKIMTEIWEYSNTKGSELLLLLAIADHANSETRQAYPSVPRLARLIRMTKRNTQYLLKKLEDGGHILIKPNAGINGTNRYTVLTPWAENQGGEKFAPLNIWAGEKNRKKGVKHLSPKPNSETLYISQKREEAPHEEPKSIEDVARRFLTPGSALYREIMGENDPA